MSFAVKAVIEKAEGIEWQGAMNDALDAFLLATRAAITGERDEASRIFSELVAEFATYAKSNDLTDVRATYAMLVGQDDPAAARAAQDAYDWLAETGTMSLMKVYADGLPTREIDEAAG